MTSIDNSTPVTADWVTINSTRANQVTVSQTIINQIPIAVLMANAW